MFVSKEKSNAFIQLRHYAAELDQGNTSRTICPWCGGGSTRETSFAVTRTSEAEAKYICHRASCGRHGRLAVWGFRLESQILSDSSPQERKSFTPRLYTGETRELGEEWAAELLDLYGLEQSDTDWAGWRTEIGSGLLVCPARSPSGVVRGYEVRRSKIQIPYVSAPKTKSYRFLDEPWLGWYRKVNSGPVILVEDHISALKVSRYFQVACLHGSHINLEMLMEVLEVTGIKDGIILALDPDATNKALKFVVEWRFLAPNFRAVPLSKDLKYVSDEGIKSLLRG